MFTIFLSTLINEIIGIIPITLVQTGFILKQDLPFFDQFVTQGVIAFAFSIGSIFLYLIGRYAGLALIKKLHAFYTKKTKKIAPDIVQARFGYVLLCRAIPFFPAKQTSIALGILKYNVFLFFISSFLGIWVRGMIMFLLFYLFKFYF